MKNNNILSEHAIQVIKNLQHSCGTYNYYRETLNRLFNYILNQSDEIGMSDTEAIHTLRALQYIREDLAAIANRQAQTPTAPATEETAAAALDAVMAIDPDNYEPQELTEAKKVALFVQRSRDALTYGKELLDDALDHAVRYDYKPLIRRLRTARELAITAVDGIAELAERADNTLGKDTDEPENVTSEEVAARVEATFENIGMTEKDEELTEETALEKADTYVKNAKQSLRDALLQLDNALDLVQHRDGNGLPIDDNIISMQADISRIRLLLTEEVFDPVFEYIEKGMHFKKASQQG